MTLVLDSGGVSALADHRARLAELRRRDLWPPVVSAAVVVEAVTGDPRRDFHTNQLLRLCVLRDVDERLAREAARLRTASGRAGEISAVDALVVAEAVRVPEPVIVTSDPADISALAAVADVAIAVSQA